MVNVLDADLYEIPTTLSCRRNGTVFPIGICYQEVFLSYSLEISEVYGTPFLKYRGYRTYLAIDMSLCLLPGFLCRHQACLLLGL